MKGEAKEVCQITHNNSFEHNLLNIPGDELASTGLAKVVNGQVMNTDRLWPEQIPGPGFEPRHLHNDHGPA